MRRSRFIIILPTVFIIIQRARVHTSTHTSRSRLGTHSYSKLNCRSYHVYITPFGSMKEITIKLQLNLLEYFWEAQYNCKLMMYVSGEF